MRKFFEALILLAIMLPCLIIGVQNFENKWLINVGMWTGLFMGLWASVFIPKWQREANAR